MYVGRQLFGPRAEGSWAKGKSDIYKDHSQCEESNEEDTEHTIELIVELTHKKFLRLTTL